MANTSNKHRNRKLWTGGIIILVVLLVVSFIVSNKDEVIDPATFADVEVQADGPHLKGNIESDIVLIEYSDFQCPACKAAEPAVSGLVDSFGDQLAVEYRHFPLRSIHPNAQIAAQAGEAAAIQGKFWEMHDILFENQSEWGQSFNAERYLKQYAEEIGLNADRFAFDLKSDEVKNRVNADADEAASIGLQGTPSFVYNGEIVDFNEFVNENIDTSTFVSESDTEQVVEETASE